MRKISLILTLALIGSGLCAQGAFTSNNRELEEIYERYSIQVPQEDLFQDMRPYHRSSVASAYLQDTNFRDSFFYPYLERELIDFCYFGHNAFEKGKKRHGFFYPNEASFIGISRDILSLRINPVLDLKLGTQNNGGEMPYTATRGGEILGSLGGVFNFYALVTENQMRPFQYIHQYGDGMNGQNLYTFNPYFTYWKDIQNNTGYDFSNAIGYVEYNPNAYLSISFGHDRNHYGYGYRSLFVGDNGAPYLQLRIHAQVWKFHYNMMVAEFTGQYIRGADRLLPKKYGAFHLLSFKPSKKWELGLYEGTMFHRPNGFDLNYLNPVIFYRSIEHSLGSSDNTTLGLQGKFQPNTHLQLYTQFLLDDIQVGEFVRGSGWWGNKYGVQLGMKAIDIADIKTLDFQAEFNAVRPFTYSHYNNDGSDTLDNFTHYNQPLAHPFGANFVEFFGKISYRPISKIKLEIKYDFSAQGLDNSSILNGANIFANTTGLNIARNYDNKITQGVRQEVHRMSFHSEYQIFHNLFLDLDVIYRTSSIPNLATSYDNIGILSGFRMNLKPRDYMF